MKLLDVFKNEIKLKKQFSYPYIIAEAGVNHEGDMELAKRLIDEAKEGGADAIKFQTYKAETLASKNSPYYWDITKESTNNQFDLFKKYDKFWKNEFEQLKKYCEKTGIEFLSTPFDEESAKFLNGMMDIFKISSSDITNKPFIDLICSFGKPIILSTGASYYYEIEEAASWISGHGNPLSLMHCVLNYPTPDENANLGVIKVLNEKYSEYIIGYSDHTLPQNMKVLEIAVLLGARILEKHFTHDKKLLGNDHYHAMDKEDLKRLHMNLRDTFSLIGNSDKKELLNEEPARKNARRSLVAKRDISEGNIISSDDLTWKRPAFGISPKFIDEVVGKKAGRLITEDEILFWELIK